MSSSRIVTQYYPQFIDSNRSIAMYEHFKDNIKWVDGIRSKNGFTRKAISTTLGKDSALDMIIHDVFQKIGIVEFGLHGIYMNYYRNGEDYTPNHSHIGMKQLIISLGATRTLTIGSKSYSMNNGDVIIFGSSIHGVPKESHCKDGRISIALFLEK
jgi:hypothetical protein